MGSAVVGRRGCSRTFDYRYLFSRMSIVFLLPTFAPIIHHKTCISQNSSNNVMEDDTEYRTCPLTGDELEKMLQKSARENNFSKMSFTKEQCRVLANSGIMTPLRLTNCKFEDGGSDFVRSYAERRVKSTGPSNLAFWKALPFNIENWASFLSLQNLAYLGLFYMNLDLEMSRVVAEARIARLELRGCTFEDDGAALIESVRTGRGPIGLSLLDKKPFNSLERWKGFINALTGSGSSESLEVWIRGDHCDEILQTLADALPLNNGLVELKLPHVSSDQWSNLVQPVSNHPSLRKLDLRCAAAMFSRTKQQQTQAVADMLLVNKQVEDISFQDSTYNRSTWNAGVAPRLEANIYRKRFLAIGDIVDSSTRAAILGAALPALLLDRTKPSLAYMLLRSNQDTIVTHLTGKTTQ
jgi:hypothetical protein